MYIIHEKDNKVAITKLVENDEVLYVSTRALECYLI